MTGLRRYDRLEMGWTTSRVGSSPPIGLSQEMGEMGGFSPSPGTRNVCPSILKLSETEESTSHALPAIGSSRI